MNIRVVLIIKKYYICKTLSPEYNIITVFCKHCVRRTAWRVMGAFPRWAAGTRRPIPVPIIMDIGETETGAVCPTTGALRCRPPPTFNPRTFRPLSPRTITHPPVLSIPVSGNRNTWITSSAILTRKRSTRCTSTTTITWAPPSPQARGAAISGETLRGFTW